MDAGGQVVGAGAGTPDVGASAAGGSSPSVADRLVAGWAAIRLELWLEWYAVPGRTGRAMRQELKANLLQATDEPGGVRGAARRLGSVRELAREAVVDDGGPRWGRGLTAAALAFGLVLAVQLVLSVVFVDGLLSAGGGEGLLLGNEVTATPAEDGSALSAGTTLGGWPLLLVPLVLLVVARPWTLLRRR